MTWFLEAMWEALLDIFDHDGSYARACRYQKEASALGAALYQMEEYISSI